MFISLFDAVPPGLAHPHRANAFLPDTVRIRGTTLNLHELVDRRYFEPERIAALRAQLQEASPFPHLVIDDLFNPALLDLVREEFDQCDWYDSKSHYESTRRMAIGSRMGPASQMYFNMINAGWFTQWVSDVTGVPYLLPDPLLFGGGLHESRAGSSFDIHLDFRRHRHVGLNNAMVFITYLNKGWQPEWGSALELWDAGRHHCVTRIQPEFGRTLLMPHSDVSFHGHPDPMTAPEGKVRRSLAAYFYTSPHAGKTREDEVSSVFLAMRRLDRTKRLARMVAPPVLWSAIRKLASY